VDDLLARTAESISFLRPALGDELPLRIHQRALAQDGTPQMAGEFLSWLQRGSGVRPGEHPTDSPLRLKRAMRMLKQVAPREHDVVWKALRGESAEEIQAWLNARAESQGHPERYSLKDATVLIVSGVDKLSIWY
jgi:hypothetical protein